MTAVLWVGVGFVLRIGLCHPNLRKGAFLGAASILSDATIQTINYQSALEHEGALLDRDPGHHDVASID